MSTLSTTSKRGATAGTPGGTQAGAPGGALAPRADGVDRADLFPAELPETARRGVRRAVEAAMPIDRGAVRPFLRRWLSAAMLLAAAVLATLYISNAIAVNDLLAGIDSLEHDRDVARSENEKLRAQLLKLMAVERVTSIAAGDLGMVQPVQPPMAIAPETRADAPAPDSATVR